MNQEPMIIHFNTQWEGFAFQLNSLSRLWLEATCPERKRLASVYIGYERKSRPEITHLPESIWNHVAELLTGLSLKN